MRFFLAYHKKPGAESANPRACTSEKNEMVNSRPSTNSLKNKYYD